MEAAIPSRNKAYDPTEIHEKLSDAISDFETHRRLGDIGGAWFHYGVALGLHQALIALGESIDSDFPGPDPIQLAIEAAEDERAGYLHLVWEALGDMDFADELPGGMEEELRLYQEGWNKPATGEGR